MKKQALQAIIVQQQRMRESVKHEVERDLLPEVRAYVPLPQALIICGIRRCGKSTFLNQIEREYYPDGVYYLTFEDERLIDFTAQDFNDLHEAFIELYGEKKVFFLDEIQNVPKWELFVRRLLNQGYKFYITGSNASMLSQELGTRLTGRHLMIEMLPYSFQEYLRANDFTRTQNFLLETSSRAKLKKQFSQFIAQGGMPEYLVYGNAETLSRTYEDILFRDIISRYRLKDVAGLRRLALYLFNNFSARVTYNSLKPILGISNTSTISNYVSYLENTYLIFTLKQFSYSLKQQNLLPKKIYVIDTGMAHIMTLNFSENRGRYLENLIYLELRRLYKEFYYYQTKTNREVDFVIFWKGQKAGLIQACYSLQDEKTKQREIVALQDAMSELKITRALILTYDEQDEIEVDEGHITVQPVYQWLQKLTMFEGDNAVVKLDHAVRLSLDTGTGTIDCDVSNNVFDEHFVNEDVNSLTNFKKHQNKIIKAAEMKYKLNQLGPNETIFLEAKDF